MARRKIILTLAAIIVGFSITAVHALPQDSSQAENRRLTQLTLDELMNIEVTIVSRQPSTVANAAAAVYVITQEDIQRSGATLLPELFRMVPGMNVARIDNNKWAVGVRGFNDRFNGKLLVQVDGRTVYNPLSSGVYWDAVDYPLDDIERIEIIRGPGASVWGANAVNGVINIISKRASNTQGGALNLRVGSEERGFVSFRYGGKLNERALYRAYGKAFLRDKQFSLLGDSNDAWRTGGGGLRIDWTKSDSDTITLQGDISRAVAQRKDFRPQSAPPFSFTNVEDETSISANVLFRWSGDLRNNSKWTVQGYWDRFKRIGSRGFVDLRFDTLDLDAQHGLEIGKRNHIVYGVGYRYIDAFLGPSTTDNGFAVSFPDPDRRTHLFSAFFQDQIAVVENKVLLTVGSKIEHNSFTGFEHQPTVRLLLAPSNRQSTWLAVSRALRTPTMSEDGIGSRQLPSFPPTLGGAPVFPRLNGNREFESEKLLAYEAGYRIQPGAIATLDAAIFYNKYADLRVVNPLPLIAGAVSGTFDLPLTFQNRMNARTYGGEFGISLQPAPSLRFKGAYSFLRMNLTPDFGLPSSVEEPEGQSPRHQIYLRSSWSLPKNLELTLAGRFVDRLPAFTPAVRSYYAADAGLTWRVAENFEFALNGQNLLADHHQEHGTAPLLRSLVVEIERGVFINLKWSF